MTNSSRRGRTVKWSTNSLMPMYMLLITILLKYSNNNISQSSLSKTKSGLNNPLILYIGALNRNLLAHAPCLRANRHSNDDRILKYQPRAARTWHIFFGYDHFVCNRHKREIFACRDCRPRLRRCTRQFSKHATRELFAKSGVSSVGFPMEKETVVACYIAFLMPYHSTCIYIHKFRKMSITDFMCNVWLRH